MALLMKLDNVVTNKGKFVYNRRIPVDIKHLYARERQVEDDPFRPLSGHLEGMPNARALELANCLANYAPQGGKLQAYFFILG